MVRMYLSTELHFLAVVVTICISRTIGRNVLSYCDGGIEQCACYDDGFVNCKGRLGSLAYVPKLPSWSTHIDLSSNDIRHIRAGDFNHITNLTLLNIALNDIDFIDRFAFVGLHHLKILDLSKKNFAVKTPYLDGSLFLPLISLETLNISRYENSSYFLELPISLRVLNVSHSRIRQTSLVEPTKINILDISGSDWNEDTFEAFPLLTKLYSNWPFNDVVVFAKHTRHLQTLSAWGKSITAALFDEWPELREVIDSGYLFRDLSIPIPIIRSRLELDLSYTLLYPIRAIHLSSDTFLNFSRCEEVSFIFDHRKVSVSPEQGLFKHIKRFSFLSFKGVKLGKVTSYVIDGLRKSEVERLNLGNVGLKAEPAGSFPMDFFLPLKGCGLRELNLLGNQLGMVQATHYQPLHTLQILRIGTITSQHPRSFAGLYNLEVLEVTFNYDHRPFSVMYIHHSQVKLKTLRITTPIPVKFHLTSPKLHVVRKLEVIVYKYFPLRSTTRPYTAIELSSHGQQIVNHTKHTSSAKVNGFHHIDQVLLFTKAVHYLELRIPNLETSRRILAVLPKISLKLKSVILSHSSVRKIPEITFTKMYHLEYLDLSYNAIQDIPEGLFRFNQKIRYLDLSFNRLTTVSATLLQRLPFLEQLFLIDNPFVCTCETIALQYWIKGNLFRVESPDKILCDLPVHRKDERVDVYDVNWLECINHLYFLISLAMILSGLLILSLASTIKFYIIDIKYILDVRRAGKVRKRRLAHRAPLHEFDAFVSYNWESQNWVLQQLRPQVMENGELDFKLCIDEEDFVPGHSIYGEIERFLASSNQIIFVVTRAFLNSDWCRYELDLTILELTRANVHRAIIIFLEYIPQDLLKASMTFQLLARHNKCLNWPTNDHIRQEVFWKKLRSELQRGQIKALG